MLLTCPHCGYSREVESAAPLSRTVRVLCPSCQQEFELDADQRPFIFETESGVAGDPPAATLPSALPKAGFWLRVLASLIDSAILTLTQIVLGGLLGVMLGLLIDGFDGESLTTLGLIWLFGSTLGLAYYVLFTAHGGQTPGKMALRIKVIRTDGGEVGLGKAFYREAVCKFISAITFGIGYLMVAFDPQKQGLHDRMAETYVVKL